MARNARGGARFARTLTFALLAALAGAAPAAPAGWDPPGWRPPPTREAALPTHPAVPPFLWALRAYRTLVSPVDGDRCPSFPTCSAYALEAFSSHGPAVGFALTAGRLLSEADEAAFAPRVWVGGQWRVYSPVEQDLAFWKGRLEP